MSNSGRMFKKVDDKEEFKQILETVKAKQKAQGEGSPLTSLVSCLQYAYREIERTDRNTFSINAGVMINEDLIYRSEKKMDELKKKISDQKESADAKEKANTEVTNLKAKIKATHDCIRDILDPDKKLAYDTEKPDIATLRKNSIVLEELRQARTTYVTYFRDSVINLAEALSQQGILVLKNRDTGVMTVTNASLYMAEPTQKSALANSAS